MAKVCQCPDVFGLDVWASWQKTVVYGRRIRPVEWNHDTSLDWNLTELPRHDGLRRLVQHLNYTYKSEPALWDQDDSYAGFDWIDFHDADNSVVAFLRKSRAGEMIAFVVNATPVVHHNYRLGVPESGFSRETTNTDAETYRG